DNKLLVNHNEMLKIYKEIAGAKSYFRKKDFMKPTPFINAYRKAGKRADVVFIDEGHLLLTAPDPYNNFRDTNQLTDILQLARLVVLVFDFHQLVKLKSFWT
ncbi:DNA/RNA helicase domain-containing protein, partial [Lacticaseibacillus paracasei]